MAKILDIVELGNPILREKAKEIRRISDPDIQKLIDDMIVTTKHASGVGLAAPQVDHSLRLFIMHSYPNDRYPEAPEMVSTPVINPRIIAYSEDLEEGWEGCLSIPGIRAPVIRHRAVSVEYYDRLGNEKVEVLEDFAARIFQHEYDHLEGIVFLDRSEDNSEIITEKEYAKLFEEDDDEYEQE